MSKIDFLKEQIIEARTFVNRLMSELPEDLWYVIPEGTDSNFIWQVGHLLVSQNFHTLTAVTGVNEKVGRLVPIQKYNRIFNGSIYSFPVSWERYYPCDPRTMYRPNPQSTGLCPAGYR